MRELKQRTKALLWASFVVLIFLALLPHAVPSFQAEPAFAADKEQASSGKKAEVKKGEKKKRRPRRERKETSPQDEKAAAVQERKPSSEFTVGAGGGFGHSEFDASASATGMIDAIILLDSSRSMQRTDPKRLRDQGARLFLRFLSEQDRVAILRFDQDVRRVVALQAIDPKNMNAIDEAIARIPNEGGFTDLEAPLRASLQLLAKKGRKEAIKAVVLLSDGKMDPHPKRGTADELMKKVLDEVLAEFRTRGFRLYTVSLSKEADTEFLKKLAEGTESIHWFAPDVEAIHLKFSDLFLTLKKPQTVPLEGKGFEIDSTVQEATFYIAHKGNAAKLTLLDPSGKSYTPTTMPIGNPWYKADFFDVITIKNPLPGSWSIGGLEEVEGYATLLSDLKLQVRWPKTTINVGENVGFLARLLEGDDVFSIEGMEKIIYFTYKIVNAETGSVVASGKLEDAGQEGDEAPDDQIYSATAKLEREGKYRALLSVTSPTFTRQQQVPFTVIKSDIALTIEAEDVFLQLPERFQVDLGDLSEGLRNLKVQLVATPIGHGVTEEGSHEETDEHQEEEGAAEETKSLVFTLHPVRQQPGVFMIPVSKIPGGSWNVQARYAGVDRRRKPVNGVSDRISFTSSAPAIEIERAPSKETDYDFVWGLIFTFLSIGWVGGLAFYSLKGFQLDKGTPEALERFVIPEELASRLEEVRGKASSSRRAPLQADIEQFALVADYYDGLQKTKEEEKKEEDESEAEAETEEKSGGEEEGKAASEGEAEAETEEAPEGETEAEAEETPEAQGDESSEEESESEAGEDGAETEAEEEEDQGEAAEESGEVDEDTGSEEAEEDAEQDDEEEKEKEE